MLNLYEFVDSVNIDEVCLFVVKYGEIPFGDQQVCIIGKVSAPQSSCHIHGEIPEYLSMRGRLLKY